MVTADACLRTGEAKSICQLLASTEEQSARSLPVWAVTKAAETAPCSGLLGNAAQPLEKLKTVKKKKKAPLRHTVTLSPDPSRLIVR